MDSKYLLSAREDAASMNLLNQAFEPRVIYMIDQTPATSLRDAVRRMTLVQMGPNWEGRVQSVFQEFIKLKINGLIQAYPEYGPVLREAIQACTDDPTYKGVK